MADDMNMDPGNTATAPDEVDLEEVACWMAWLEQRITECDELSAKHYSGDECLDPNFFAHIRQAAIELTEELVNLQSSFPNVVPNHEAPQPVVPTGNFPDRSDEIDPKSEDPRHLDFAVALVRSSYRRYKEYCGPETLIAKLKQRIAVDEEALRQDLTRLDPATGAEEGTSLVNCTGWRHFDLLFSRAYHQQKTYEFIHQIARNSASGDAFGFNPGQMYESIAYLGNHNLDRASAAPHMSISTGMSNIFEGAREWLDSLQGPNLRYQLALPDINPKEYWFNLWRDAHVDQKQVTYEKLYIGVSLIAAGRYLIYPSITGYVRGVMDVLMFGDTLSQDQALVLARLIQLAALTDHNDEQNVNVERDIVNALPQMLEHCKASRFVFMEYLAALRTRAGPDPMPGHVYKQLGSMRLYLGQFAMIYYENQPMVMINQLQRASDWEVHVGRRTYKQQRWIVPVDEMTIWYEDGAMDKYSSRIRTHLTVKDIWIDGKFESEEFVNFFRFQADVEAELPGVKVQMM